MNTEAQIVVTVVANWRNLRHLDRFASHHASFALRRIGNISFAEYLALLVEELASGKGLSMLLLFGHIRDLLR